VEYYDWTQESDGDFVGSSRQWYLRIELVGHHEWDLRAGRYIEGWDPHTTAYYEDEPALTDYPFTNNALPVYSPRLKAVMEGLGLGEIQYLPLRVRDEHGGGELLGYHIANYLRVIDCLDRERSAYQVWTRDNLLFWEQTPWKLGTFRDVTKAVVDSRVIGDVPLFRLWGWTMIVVVREDVKREIERAQITGCRFSAIEVV
jgi:hypothetical protein